MSDTPPSSPPPNLDKPADLAAQLWSYPELAQVFGVEVSTIKRWAKQGRLPRPIVMGKRRLWPAGQIRALVGAAKG